jgi:hypothetical protein
VNSTEISVVSHMMSTVSIFIVQGDKSHQRPLTVIGPPVYPCHNQTQTAGGSVVSYQSITLIRQDSVHENVAHMSNPGMAQC